jgi:hypothetical protein
MGNFIFIVTEFPKYLSDQKVAKKNCKSRDKIVPAHAIKGYSGSGGIAA